MFGTPRREILLLKQIYCNSEYHVCKEEIIEIVYVFMA